MLLTQPYKNDTHMTNAQRPAKNQFYIREKRFNPLGRTDAICAVLQIIESKTPSATLCALARIPSQKVLSRGSFACPYIRHYGRNRQNRKYPIFGSQRFYPVSFRPAGVPSQGYLKDFSLEIQFREYSKPPARPRQIQGTAFSEARNNLLSHYRRGYDRINCLWASGAGPNGLQSQISRETLLRPAYFQRRPNRIFSGNAAKAGQSPSCQRSFGILGADYRETAQYYSLIQNPYTLRRLFLQRRNNTIFRRQKHKIRYSRQNLRASKVTDAVCPLPRVYQGLGSSGFYFSSLKLQERASLYRHQAAQITGTRRSEKESFYLQELRLSQSISYQSGYHSGSSLEILLQQRLPGAPTSRIQKFFLHGSNPHQELLGKCRVYGNDPLGVRPDSGFSISVSTQRVSALEHFNTAQRTLVAAGRMDQTRQQQYPAAPKTIPAAGFIFQDSKSNFRDQTPNLDRFANIFFITPTSTVKKEPFIAVFQVDFPIHTNITILQS